MDCRQRGVDFDGVQAHIELPARVAHGLRRVHPQVQHDLVQLGRVGEHQARLHGEVVHQRNRVGQHSP